MWMCAGDGIEDGNSSIEGPSWDNRHVLPRPPNSVGQFFVILAVNIIESVITVFVDQCFNE